MLMKRFLYASMAVAILLSVVVAGGPTPTMALTESVPWKGGGFDNVSVDISTEASNYFVSVSGSDSNAGTESAPWRHIQYAVNQVGPGSTIYVMEGVYKEKVRFSTSGSSSGGYITLQNYPGHTPVIDGSGLGVKDEKGLIVIRNKSYIRVVGLRLRNLKASSSSAFPAGIWVKGHGHHIELVDNVVHHIENSCRNCGAHGIAVYGRSANASIHDILIEGNEVRNCKLGWSESLVLNGNVEDFLVLNNSIHDNDNIGIDLIGYEGECPDPALDRPRDGVVAGNLVFNIDSRGNPAYGDERCADGIYVDGGTRIVIERNIVHDTNIGIELASEHSGTATNYVTVRNNFVYKSHQIGLAMGGYDSRRGRTARCTIVNNTFYHNDTDRSGGGEVCLQYKTRYNVVKNNIFYANSQNLFIANDFVENTGNVFDYNIYYSPGGANGSEWEWKQVTYSSFASWRTGTGNDAHSLFVNPRFVDRVSGDLHLRGTSPAINAGENLPAGVIGTQDIDGQARNQGGVDIGADERQ
jgi:hypothetical protein